MDWYPWYPALFRADTMHLTAEQDGIYRRLIDHYMETRQPLPDHAGSLARIAGITIDCWQQNSSVICEFFRPLNGRLHHKRCNAELERQDGRNKNQSEKGKLGAKKRWENRKQNQHVNSSGYATAMASPMPSDGRGEERRGEENIKDEEASPRTEANRELAAGHNGTVAKRYAFEGRTVRLTFDDYNRWRRSYSKIDILSHLQSIDDWFEANPDAKGKWFHATSAMLRKANDAAKPATDRPSFRKVITNADLAEGA